MAPRYINPHAPRNEEERRIVENLGYYQCQQCEQWVRFLFTTLDGYDYCAKCYQRWRRAVLDRRPRPAKPTTPP